MVRILDSWAGPILFGTVLALGCLLVPSCAPSPTAAQSPSIWEDVPTEYGMGIIWRTRVPGGWVVARTNSNSAPCFVPDPNHEWLKPEKK